MTVLFDYEILGMPHKDQMAFPVFNAIKNRILKALENHNNKYNIYIVVSIKLDGVKLYYLSNDTDLIKVMDDFLSEKLNLSDISNEIWGTQNN